MWNVCKGLEDPSTGRLVNPEPVGVECVLYLNALNKARELEQQRSEDERAKGVLYGVRWKDQSWTT
jgi:hypothetical protein